MITIGFSTTDKLISRIIRWATNSPVSHTFVLFDVYGIPMVLEAAFEETRLKPYAYFTNGNNIVATFDVVCSDEAIKMLLLNLSTPYDFGGLFGFFFVQVGRFLRQKWHNPWDNRQALFCSELITGWLKAQNYPGSEELEPKSTSPNDLLILLSSK